MPGFPSTPVEYQQFAGFNVGGKEMQNESAEIIVAKYK